MWAPAKRASHSLVRGAGAFKKACHIVPRSTACARDQRLEGKQLRTQLMLQNYALAKAAHNAAQGTSRWPATTREPGVLASPETCKLSRNPPELTRNASVQCRLYVNLSACPTPLAVLAGASPEHLRCQLLGSLRPPSSQNTNH